ncbi:MAG TPA: DUF1648 domain-containing protein, partial [Polyangia bacterium]
MTPYHLMLFVLPAQVLLVGILMFVTPRLTRPDILFSVTVDPAFRASGAGRRILRGFRAATIASSAAALLVIAAGLATKAPWLIGAGVVLQVVGQTLAFLAAHRRTLPHATPPSPVREAALAPHRPTLPGGVAGQAGPFVILAAAAAWIGSRWERLPARFPVHWNISGRADGWADRSLAGVFGSIVDGAVMCALLLLLAWLLLTRSRRIAATGDRAQAEQRFRLTTSTIVLATEYLLAGTFALLTALPLLGSPSGVAAAVTLGTFVFVVATVVVLARLGQGGTRLAAANVAAPPVGDRTADANWRWGLVYVNRNDPALLVEKRF